MGARSGAPPSYRRDHLRPPFAPPHFEPFPAPPRARLLATAHALAQGVGGKRERRAERDHGGERFEMRALRYASTSNLRESLLRALEAERRGAI